jgi:rhamnogalacturonan acetylesterase
MKMLFTLVLLLSTTALALAQAVPPAQSALPTLWIIGDSTVKNPLPGLEGWGTPIAAFFDASKIRVENRAIGGRSSRSYRTEGHWADVLSQIRPGDFVLMQFGHNDGGGLEKSPYRASIHGNGDETQVAPANATGKTEVVHSYGWYMRQYIAEAKAKGATAIVVTPIPRNIWGSDGKVLRNTKDYGLWATEAAAAEGAPVIDLNKIIADQYDTLGEATVKAYFPGDHTHTSPAGAQMNAAGVVTGIRALTDCPLKDDLLPAKQ